jgi:hypothetical protein
MSDTSDDDLAVLGLLAEQLENDAEFIAWALSRFRRQEHLRGSRALAKRFGISPLQLVRLALCKRPPSNASDFASRVQTIAAFASIDPITLANLLRQVELFHDWPSESADTATLTDSFLAAARDRVEDSTPPKPESESDE